MGEENKHFLKEKKAWISIGIIIGFLVLCVSPMLIVSLAVRFPVDLKLLTSWHPLVQSCLMLNSQVSVYSFLWYPFVIVNSSQ